MTKPRNPYDTTPCRDPSIYELYPSSQVYLTAHISLNSELILVKFWILNLMTKPNKPYDTTPCLDPSCHSQAKLKLKAKLGWLDYHLEFTLTPLFWPKKLNNLK